MKIIINNTNIPSTIILEGTEYSVGAQSVSSLVTDAIASKWVKTHSFLIAQDSVEEKKAVIKDKETTESISEEPVEETVVKSVEKKIKKIIK